MNADHLEQIVNAVLYEGYILYPYRPSSSKNRRERFTFGRVYPEAYSAAQKGAEPCLMQTECLMEAASETAALNLSVRFLHPIEREIGVLEQPLVNWSGAEPFRIVPELRVGDSLFQAWHEAVERQVAAPSLRLGRPESQRLRIHFDYPSVRSLEPIRDGARAVGVILRRQAGLEGTIEVGAHPLGSGLFKITVRVLNQTPVPEAEINDQEAVLLRTLASTHTILQVQGGAFISLLDPAPEHKEAAAACRNIGTWPVLVGDEAKRERDTMLSSPIILYDYPQIAPESAGPLFDGTEIDELLTLRIRTMTDQEKLEMRQVDEQARRLLERAETLTDETFLKMHGAMRPAPGSAPIGFDDFFGTSTPLKGVSVRGVYLQAGDRVRIRPKARADVIDLALEGQIAIVEAVEEDLEHRVHLAVVLENDPGKDLGLMRQPGHRFFYGVDEVEPLREEVS